MSTPGSVGNVGTNGVAAAVEAKPRLTPGEKIAELVPPVPVEGRDESWLRRPLATAEQAFKDENYQVAANTLRSAFLNPNKPEARYSPFEKQIQSIVAELQQLADLAREAKESEAAAIQEAQQKDAFVAGTAQPDDSTYAHTIDHSRPSERALAGLAGAHYTTMEDIRAANPATVFPADGSLTGIESLRIPKPTQEGIREAVIRNAAIAANVPLEEARAINAVLMNGGSPLDLTEAQRGHLDTLIGAIDKAIQAEHPLENWTLTQPGGPRQAKSAKLENVSKELVAFKESQVIEQRKRDANLGGEARRLQLANSRRV